ncbi:polysaccharide deacetylase family protein, partial [Streptomyces sp. CRN 30]|uniref:polysaccharide deacetylase family protein n=1 Tax=Streptomyces sp. CRN 30 TaxID=3075613 RepID=UPI002A814C72
GADADGRHAQGSARAGERAAGATRHAYRRWGLAAPLAPRPERPDRPSAAAATDVDADAGPGLPPVVERVPTEDAVVFLTFDDGAERDPHFVDLVRELRLPVTMFLTDSVAGPGYGHFARLRGVGAGLQNHTLDHRSLRGLPYAGQRAEICGQQEKLRRRFGVRPTLLRPPYGTYDTTTLHAAADCGVSAVVLGRASMQADGLRYTGGGTRLRPGDIVIVMADARALQGPGGPGGVSLTEMTTRLLRRIQEEGLTVGRLEDYL